MKGPDMNKTILYIEDNMDNMRVVRKLVESMGYRFIWGWSGLQGIGLYKEHKPDMIFLDIDLHDISGIDVVRHIRKAESAYQNAVPIIAVSGDTRETSIRQALDNGCDEFIEKPINLRQLKTKIEFYLNLKYPVIEGIPH